MFPLDPDSSIPLLVLLVLVFLHAFFAAAEVAIVSIRRSRLSQLIEEGHQVLVRWHFPDEDEDMEEAGEEYADIVDVPFEMVSYS